MGLNNNITASSSGLWHIMHAERTHLYVLKHCFLKNKYVATLCSVCALTRTHVYYVHIEHKVRFDSHVMLSPKFKFGLRYLNEVLPRSTNGTRKMTLMLGIWAGVVIETLTEDWV